MIQANRSMGDIALLRMPWDCLGQPSPALGLISAILKDAGHQPRTFHPNFWLADQVGLERYDSISAGAGWLLLSEFIFSKAAFPEHFTLPTGDVIAEWDAPKLVHLPQILGEGYRDTLIDLRDVVAQRFCRDAAERCAGFRVVGISCTINQLLPSLALARELKRIDPGVKILLGGTQVEGEMGDQVLRIAPWVDAIYKGEAEVAGVAAFEWLLGQRETAPEEYLSYRRPDGGIHEAPSVALQKDLDALPMPDYDAYFELLENYDKGERRIRFHGLPFISSRGCWWGEKRHCTFCGLNGEGMVYRKKSPDKVIDEMLGMVRRYKSLKIVAVDNIIPHEYLETVLPRIKTLGLDLELFYETKSNLRRRDVELYRESGMRLVQPGIESLSDHVLELMRKGVTTIQNVFLLKLGIEHKIGLQWNLLFGFPGETPEDYRAIIDLIPKLHHLAPPMGTSHFVLQRFSPFHFEPEKLGVKSVRADGGYRYVYPEGAADLDRLAFYFDFDTERPQVDHALMVELRMAARAWQRRWRKGRTFPMLTIAKGPGFVVVRDSRNRQMNHRHVIDGLEMEVLLACEDPITWRALGERFNDGEALRAAVRALDALGLVYDDGRRLLSLPVPLERGFDLRTNPMWRSNSIDDATERMLAEGPPPEIRTKIEAESRIPAPA